MFEKWVTWNPSFEFPVSKISKILPKSSTILSTKMWYNFIKIFIKSPIFLKFFAICSNIWVDNCIKIWNSLEIFKWQDFPDSFGRDSRISDSILKLSRLWTWNEPIRVKTGTYIFWLFLLRRDDHFRVILEFPGFQPRRRRFDGRFTENEFFANRQNDKNWFGNQKWFIHNKNDISNMLLYILYIVRVQTIQICSCCTC